MFLSYKFLSVYKLRLSDVKKMAKRKKGTSKQIKTVIQKEDESNKQSLFYIARNQIDCQLHHGRKEHQSHISTVSLPIEISMPKRRRCHICPYSISRNQNCATCLKNVCKQHSIRECLTCRK